MCPHKGFAAKEIVEIESMPACVCAWNLFFDATSIFAVRPYACQQELHRISVKQLKACMGCWGL